MIDVCAAVPQEAVSSPIPILLQRQHSCCAQLPPKAWSLEEMQLATVLASPLYRPSMSRLAHLCSDFWASYAKAWRGIQDRWGACQLSCRQPGTSEQR